MYEKGKKRAKRRMCLILGSLIITALRHLVAIVQAKFEGVLGQAIKTSLSFIVDG